MNLLRTIEEGLKFSLLSFKDDKKLIKYLGILILVYVISLIISSLIIGLTITSIEPSAESVVEQLGTMFALFGIIGIPTFIIITIISFLIIKQGLLIEKKKTIDLTLVNYIKFLLIGIATAFAAFFSIYNLKFLAILVIGFLLSAIGFILLAINPIFGGMIIALGLVVIFAYFFVIIYNSLRLALTDITFIESGSITDALKKSWQVTKGNVLNLLIALVVFGIVISIITMVFQIPAIFYGFMIVFSQGISGEAVNEIALYADPIYIILIIPIYMVTSYSILASYLFLIKIYKLLKK